MNNPSYLSSEIQCPVCNSTRLQPFLSIEKVPVYCHLVSHSREEALSVPKGDIRLVFCHACSHIFNASYDPGLLDYHHNYENSLHFSPIFQNYALSQVDHLIESYALREKNLAEIGSGHGEFISLLCERGNNQGTGFDPSYQLDSSSPDSSEHVNFIPDYFRSDYLDNIPDLIATRHTLEHLSDPAGFVRTIREAIAEKKYSVTYIEVPNALFVFHELSVWDIIYEHFSYFTPTSLRALIESNGFRVERLSEAFDGQFLTVEAFPNFNGQMDRTQITGEVIPVAEIISQMAAKYHQKIMEWGSKLQKINESKLRAIVWGAGSKAVTFLNVLKDQSPIEFVVDINPRKHGAYVAGSGQMIVSPEFLKDYQPDIVIIMNSIYREEIALAVGKLGLSVELLQA